MKIIADLDKKTLKIYENERSIFKGEQSADKLEEIRLQNCLR